MEAARCPSDDEMGPWSVSITPKGFSMSTTLEITFECKCFQRTVLQLLNHPGRFKNGKKKKKIDRVKCSPQVSVVVLEYVRKTVQPAAVVEL